MEHTKPNDCYTNIFGCESQVNIILLEFRSGWLSVSSSLTALSSSSKIITDRDFRDLSFERISFLLYLCSNRRSPLGLRELKLGFLLHWWWWEQVAARLGCVNWNIAFVGCANLGESRSPLGLRELKPSMTSKKDSAVGRSPLGLRELKHLLSQHAPPIQSESQPAWAAWIETKNSTRWCTKRKSRSPLGLRELKQLLLA